MKHEHWKLEPEEHDFPAARDYLSLLLDDDSVLPITEAMRTVATRYRKAKDLLRASSLPILPRDNVHVAAELEKIKKGERLSPVLVVRGSLASSRAMTIADGYHRICASYHVDENADIPCRIADFNPPSLR